MRIYYTYKIMLELVFDLVIKELIKDTLPFVVCILTFVVSCFAFKFIFKANRYNPVVYIASITVVFVAYFAFIELFGLSRYDYFLDGVTVIYGIVHKMLIELARYLALFTNLLQLLKYGCNEMMFAITSYDVNALYITYKTTKRIVLFNIYYIIHIIAFEIKHVYNSVKEMLYTSTISGIEPVFNC